jgi:hypothetical protein
MGKYNRDWADGLGKQICENFNSVSTDPAISLAISTIKERFPDSTHIEWTGDNDYSAVGDINVYEGNKLSWVIELKSSQSNGKGTSANVSQSFFAQWFESGIGYSDWEKEDGVWSTRYSIVEKLTGEHPKNQTAYIKACRKLRDEQLLGDIISVTNAKKSEYIDVVESIIDSDPKRMSVLLHILRKGIHTIDGIKKALEDETTQVPRVLLIGQRLSTDPQWFWETKASECDDEIVALRKTGAGIEIEQQSGQRARFQLHWKNVAQGVQTPCFNIWY